ncbi:MAG: permease [Erysipelotrichia bacterium]|jgi:uncharacterized membrane protein YraQ (UPF0718 family)|nr:permease [Erysipelotrichia bacterium]
MNQILYGVTFTLLGISALKDLKKTKQALMKAWKGFEGMLPQILTIILVIGIIIAVLSPEQIASIMGEQSGWWGIMLASLIGAITLMPGFVAFPLAATLLNNGAGLSQIAAFISSLMMVGFITLPLEIQHFGKKAALLRNGLAFLFSFVVAILIGVIL